MDTTQERTRLPQGLVQVYTGDGKGKTTASLGLCLRAVGCGFRVLFVQFLKGGNTTGELASCEAFADRFVIRQVGTPLFIRDREPTAEERQLAEDGLRMVTKALQSGKYDIVVMDEISHAVNLKLLETAAVEAAVRSRHPQVEVVLTGRNMPEPLLDMADLVSEIHAVKHPLAKGIKARRGIEG